MTDTNKYSDSEKEALAWIEQTDIDQFSLMELFVMYDARERVKNEHIQGVSKPIFYKWMESKGYWKDESFAWKGREGYLTVDDLLSLKKEHKNL